jgi:putative restriction endonuclease
MLHHYPVRAYVGVTDGDWYRYLAARPTLAEVNFWRPGGSREFHALSIGEPFFFKTHYPHNSVVGGGFYSGFRALRVSEAWEFFGEANGAPSLFDMRNRIARYRRTRLGSSDDPLIGCVFVRDVTFFPQNVPAEPPPDFAPNIVQGKSYDLSSGMAKPYFDTLFNRLLGVTIELDAERPWHRPGPVFGDPRLTAPRLGQQAFQAVVYEAYHRHCAVTGVKIRPVLQAAHIRPLHKGGEHRADNGLLLRSDVHTLYDRGYLAVDPRHKLMVSPRLRDEFGNGEEFYARAGEVIDLPERRADKPNREFLEWHLDEVFQAS